MSGQHGLGLLDEAHARSEALADRLRAHVERVHLAREHLHQAVTHLRSLEHDAATHLATAKQQLVDVFAEVQPATHAVTAVLSDAHARLTEVHDDLGDLQVAHEAELIRERMSAHFDHVDDSATSASHAFEQVHATLAESRASVAEASDGLHSGTEEASGLAEDAAHALEEALRASSQQLKHSLGTAAQSMITHEGSFDSHVQQIVSTTVQAGLKELGDRTRTLVHDAVRTKTREAVRALKDELMKALDSFERDGSAVGEIVSIAADLFGDLGHAHSNTASAAHHVHAEADRLESEQHSGVH